MIANHWWRAHHGISNDAKLAVVALKCGAKRCEVGWVWLILLDYASQNEERGNITGLDHEQIAVMADLSPEKVSEIIGQLKQRELIQQDGRLSAWDKRQPKREREDETAAERKRRQRAKSHNVTPENGDVTPPSAMTRTEERREEEIRGEENKTSCANSGEDFALNGEIPRKRPLKSWYEESHLVWYSKYWCKKSKADSERAYTKAINRLVDRDKLQYNGARLFLISKAESDRQRFEHTPDWESRVKLYPATWLNAERWTDELGPVAVPKPIQRLSASQSAIQKAREEDKRNGVAYESH